MKMQNSAVLGTLPSILCKLLNGDRATCTVSRHLDGPFETNDRGPERAARDPRFADVTPLAYWALVSAFGSASALASPEPSAGAGAGVLSFSGWGPLQVLYLLISLQPRTFSSAAMASTSAE